MHNLQAMFLIQSREGHVAQINFEILKSLCNLDIILVGSQNVVADVEKQGYNNCLHGNIIIDSAYDFEEIAASVSDYANKVGYHNFIISTINESKNLLVNQLNVYFGQSAKLDIEKFVRKDIMKDFLVDEGIIENKHTVIEKGKFEVQGKEYLKSITSQYGYPVFIKPVDMFGSKHCAKLRDEEEFYTFMKETGAIEPCEFHIEPYIKGNMYACDSIVVEGKVSFSQLVEYSHPNINVHTRACLGWITVPENDVISRELSEFSKVINEKMLPNRSGVTHLEAFHNEAGKHFVEIAFRPIGGKPTPFYQKRANIPLREMHLALQATPEIRIPNKTKNHVAHFHINFADTSGEVSSRNLPEILSNFEIEWFCKPGDSVPKNSGFDAYAGSLLLWNEDYKILREDFLRISEFSDFISLERH